jgi:predicted Rossmann fold flavoprotein
VPVRVDAPWVADLKGLTVPDCATAVVDGTGRAVMERREAVLFAHFGLTGPAVLDVSRAVARWAEPGPPTLRIDWAPGERAEAVEAAIGERARRGRPSAAALVPEHLPRRLAEALVAAAGVPTGRVGPELTREERRRLVGAVKGLTLPVAGTLGFAKAEVTSGGVALGEVSPETLESRLRPGLFLCGEVLDLDGRIGGYNFQAAWSTGWLAGEMAAKG